MTSLEIQNFAQIRDVSVTFGDLTLLVGAQGTGKSLVLQWLKAAIDGKQIVGALRDAGHDVGRSAALVDLIFGVGMGAAWGRETVVRLDRRLIRPETLARRGTGSEQVFFIPAHRALLISDGWAAPFQKLTADTPVVARLFSQNLFERFNARDGERLFPLERVLKKQYRDLIDRAVFHGGEVGVERDRHTRRLRMTHGTAQLPFMTWTAGQREFTPLLLGLYHLIPPRGELKVEGLDWVIIEEPEMGLHPQAIAVFMLLVLELLWRGYRVVISTHSPLVLVVGWMLRQLHGTGGRWQLLCDAFGVPATDRAGLRKVAEAGLRRSVRTYLLAFDAKSKQVHSKDISSLDPGDEDDDIAGWGGLTGFSARFSDVVRRAVNEAEVG